VSKGSSSFAQVFRYMLFNIAPMIVEIIFIVAAIGYLYPQKYFWLNLGCIVIYLLSTVLVTEWRAKYFKV
jgi:ATP-binding cassette subfamily B protein